MPVDKGRVIRVRGETRDGQLRDWTLYGVGQAGRLLGVSRYQIARMIDNGLLNPAATGERYRQIWGREIRRLIETQTGLDIQTIDGTPEP